MLAAAFIAPAPVTISLTFAAAFFLEFVPAPLAIPLPAFAFNARAPLALVLARFGGGRGIGWRGRSNRRTLARLVKLPMASSAPVMFALLAFARLAGPSCGLRGRRLRTLLRT